MPNLAQNREEAYQILTDHLRLTVRCEMNGHEGAYMWIDSDGGLLVFRQVCTHCSKVTTLLLAPEEAEELRNRAGS